MKKKQTAMDTKIINDVVASLVNGLFSNMIVEHKRLSGLIERLDERMEILLKENAEMKKMLMGDEKKQEKKDEKKEDKKDLKDVVMNKLASVQKRLKRVVEMCRADVGKLTRWDFEEEEKDVVEGVLEQVRDARLILDDSKLREKLVIKLKNLLPDGSDELHVGIAEKLLEKSAGSVGPKRAKKRARVSKKSDPKSGMEVTTTSDPKSGMEVIEKEADVVQEFIDPVTGKAYASLLDAIATPVREAEEERVPETPNVDVYCIEEREETTDEEADDVEDEIWDKFVQFQWKTPASELSGMTPAQVFGAVEKMIKRKVDLVRDKAFEGLRKRIRDKLLEPRQFKPRSKGLKKGVVSGSLEY